MASLHRQGLRQPDLHMTTSDIAQLVAPLADQFALPLIAAVALLVIIIYLTRNKVKSRWLNFKTRRCLKRLGLKQITDFCVPDGLGSHYTIDHLILRHDGITVLEYKQYPGKIFCADNIDNWTQMLGRKSYRFKNPFYDLECKIRAVSACVPGVPVNGYLFFDHLAEFPKGHPERVIYPGEIPQHIKRNKKQAVEKPVAQAWKHLSSMTAG